MRRLGVTLIELVVVLTLLGTMAAVVGLMLGHSTHAEGQAHRLTILLASTRSRALRLGRPVHEVTTVFLQSGAEHSRPDRTPYAVEFTALPDGRIVADSVFGAEPLDGRPRPDGGARGH